MHTVHTILFNLPEYCLILTYMKTNGNDKALESYKIFPYVAWLVTIGFAIFVYNITVELQTVTRDLQVQTSILMDKINTPAEQIEDFES